VKVELIGCICLSGKMNRLRDMLVAEGFELRVVKIRRPGHLRVIANGQCIWSWRLFRAVPRQLELAEMVRAAYGV